VYLDCRVGHRRGQYEIDQNIGIGARVPAYCTAAGKVLIANLAPAERISARLGYRRTDEAGTSRA
jgi:DNA-binding IclR family transcriptional regulator